MIRKFVLIAAASTAISMLASCEDQKASEPDAAEQLIAEFKARQAGRELELSERDKRDYPFDSKMDIESLTKKEIIRLCGDDHHRIAVGWPIKKALVCAGERRFRLVSEISGGIRIWQECNRALGCLTLGEKDGRVASWNW